VLPPSAKIFSLLHDETLRLAQLVEDVLQLARADAASGNLELNPTDLGILVKSSLETFLPRFSRKGINVNFHDPKDPVTVPMDQKRITRVLGNLTENAVQYTPQNGQLDILLETNSQQVRIDYTNSLGELIPEDLPYLFERFYRGEKSRSREHGGAGIGLAIVKELVEAHGGTVGTEIIDGRFRIWFSLPMNPPLGTE
jgi:signal transduction histidine kinase